MRITPDEVRRIAALARIQLDDAEVQKMAADMDAILGHFETLGRLPLDDVAPTAQSVALDLPMRDDEVERSLPVEEALRPAPESRDGHFVVPKVL